MKETLEILVYGAILALTIWLLLMAPYSLFERMKEDSNPGDCSIGGGI